MTFLNSLLGRVVRGMGRTARHRSRHGHDSLLPVNRLMFFLERARFQSNRNNSPFCLVALSIDPQDCDGEALTVLVGILNERLRITDDKGYLEDGRIGVVLPDTPETGAQVVTRDVCEKYRALGGSVDCEIFVYPGDFDIDGTPLFDEEELDAEIPLTSQAPARPMQAMFSRHPPLWKRAADIAGALLLLVWFAPVLLLAAIIVKLSSPGPVFFVQQRAGLGGRPFRMFKFRTMRLGADAEKVQLRQLSEQDGPAFKLSNDPRVTWLGRLLRSTSLDELPQLINVVQGDMSLVGPRPLPLEESDECEPWQRRRLDVAPGITCIWQVTGRSSVSFAEWVRMDIEYVKSMSPWQDLKLLLLTVPSVLLCKGAK